MDIVKKFNQYIKEEWVSSDTTKNGQDNYDNYQRKKIINNVSTSLKKHNIDQYFEQPYIKTISDEETGDVWWNWGSEFVGRPLQDNEGEQIYGVFALKKPFVLDWISEDYKLKFFAFAISSNITIGGENSGDAILDFSEFDEEINDIGDVQSIVYYADEDVWMWYANEERELEPDEFGDTEYVNIKDVIICITEVLNPKSKYLNDFFIS